MPGLAQRTTLTWQESGPLRAQAEVVRDVGWAGLDRRPTLTLLRGQRGFDSRRPIAKPQRALMKRHLGLGWTLDPLRFQRITLAGVQR